MDELIFVPDWDNRILWRYRRFVKGTIPVLRTLIQVGTGRAQKRCSTRRAKPVRPSVVK
jgi:hypothetical protein